MIQKEKNSLKSAIMVTGGIKTKLAINTNQAKFAFI